MALGAKSLEVMRALAVLALVFFNFAHAPAVSASPGGLAFAVAGDSYCGAPLDERPQNHAPCHACRIGSGADLPPPPASIDCAPAIVAVTYQPVVSSTGPAPLITRPRARGPPLI